MMSFLVNLCLPSGPPCYQNSRHFKLHPVYFIDLMQSIHGHYPSGMPKSWEMLDPKDLSLTRDGEIPNLLLD